MAMTMIGEVQLPASRGAVWAMLNEPAMLKSCIPGCESLDKDSDSEFRAVRLTIPPAVFARARAAQGIVRMTAPSNCPSNCLPTERRNHWSYRLPTATRGVLSHTPP